MERTLKLLIRRYIAYSVPRFFRRKIPKTITKHFYFNGIVKFNVTPHRKIKMLSQGLLLENELHWYGLEGYHEKLSMKIWIEFIKIIQPKVILDIGANTGIYGLVAKSIAPTSSSVIFFEPIPRAVSLLEKNLIQNKFEAKVLNLALSDYDGDGFYNLEVGKDIAYSITINDFADRAISGIHNDSISYEKIQTKVARIDTLIDLGLVSIPDLIKLDVETLEPNVLAGFGETLSNNMSFLCEVLTWEIAEKLNNIFEGSEYCFYNIDDSNNSLRKTQEIEKSDFWNYFICKREIADKLPILNLLGV